MKMPATKKERMLMFALGGVVGVVVLIGGVLWGVLPLLDGRRAMQSSLVEIGEKLKKAKRELDYAPAIQREADDAVSQMERIRAENILRPILGSYLVGVSEQIESVARSTQVHIEEIREVGVVNTPAKGKNRSLQEFKSFVVQVNAEASFAAIFQFLQKMEERNPFFCVNEIGISSQSDSPEKQRLTVRMEWPIEPKTEGAKGGGL
jgi:hypothetical protein